MFLPLLNLIFSYADWVKIMVKFLKLPFFEKKSLETSESLKNWKIAIGTLNAINFPVLLQFFKKERVLMIHIFDKDITLFSSLIYSN